MQIFWSDEELEMIKISYLYNVMLEHKDPTEKEFSSIQDVCPKPIFSLRKLTDYLVRSSIVWEIGNKPM